MTSSSPATDSSFRAAQVFGHPDAHPVILVGLLFKEFDLEWLDWEPDVLWFEIHTTFSERLAEMTGGRVSATVSALSRNKIQAMKTVLQSGAFFRSWEVFAPVVQALNNNIPQFHTLQRPSVAQMMAALDMLGEATLEKNKFSDEVTRFIAACALDDGVYFLPEPLVFAQVAVARPYYRCADCGNHDEIDLEDKRCDVCTRRWSPTTDSRAFNGKPSFGIPDSVGRNIEFYFKNDPRSVQAKWEQVKHMDADEVELQEVSTDVVVAKLLVARDYVKHRQSLMDEQKSCLSPLLVEV